MRKYIRAMMRAQARKEKASPSKWVKAAFHHRQTKKYGAKQRTFNHAVGTHKKKLWQSRVALFAER
jgi:hypothetical protein